jgi:hypothetical protein
LGGERIVIAFDKRRREVALPGPKGAEIAREFAKADRVRRRVIESVGGYRGREVGVGVKETCFGAGREAVIKWRGD